MSRLGGPDQGPSTNQCAGAAHRGGYVDPNWPRPDNSDSACIIIYGYVPSLTLCVIALTCFFLALFIHSWQLFKYRTWYFATMIIGLALEIVGYISRTLSSRKNPYSVSYFVVQYFFIVTAPVMFSAAIYTLISIAIKRIGRQYSPLPPKAILFIFIAADVLCTLVQVAGAGLIGAAESSGNDPTTPNHILLAGLSLQVLSFFVFIIIYGIFVYRSRMATTREFKVFALAAFIATLAVYLRTIFRLAETAEGLMHNLSTHEVFFGCLEFLPILTAVYIFIVWHPGKWLGSKIKLGKALEHGIPLVEK